MRHNRHAARIRNKSETELVDAEGWGSIRFRPILFESVRGRKHSERSLKPAKGSFGVLSGIGTLLPVGEWRPEWPRALYWGEEPQGAPADEDSEPHEAQNYPK